MWRTRAVVSMLVEDIASLETPVGNERDADPTEDNPEAEPLARAIRKARLVIIVDWLAILILFLFRDQTRPFLPANQTIETVFTLGVLAVAAHAGFRWAQLDRLQAVRRLCVELRQRQQG